VNLDSLPGLLLAWLKTQGSALLQPGQSAGKPQELPFKAGEQYQGKVLDSLLNGRSLVKVADQTLDMALPRNVRVGETVRLTYVNAAPRPTFLLDQSPVQASQAVRLSSASQQVGALIRFAATPAAPANPSTAPAAPPSPAAPPTVAVTAAPASALAQRPVVVNVAMLQAARGTPGLMPASSAAPGITSLPGAGMSAATVEGLRAAIASGTVLTTQLIWDQPGQASHVLPQRLRQVMRESGLFYESHQVKWVKGETTLEMLQREPQARLAKLDLPQANLPELKGLPEETARLAGRQLMMLEGQPFVWQGQAWPGQPMEWLVEEREADPQGDPDAPAWRTQLRLVLPRLGELEADLRLGPAGLQVRLKTGDEAILQEVRAALPELMRRLEAAHLNPSAITAEAGHGPAA
jgi:hypothetical protein